MTTASQAAGVAIGVALLAGCRSAHHQQLVLQPIGAKSKHELTLGAEVIHRRLGLLGMKKATMETKPNGRLVITMRRKLPLGKQLLLVKPGSLAFYDLEADLARPSKNARGDPIPASRLTGLLQRATGSAGRLFLVNAKGQLVGGPQTTRRALFAIAKLRGDVPKGAEVLAAPANTTVVTCEAGPTNGCPGTNSPRGTFYYLFKYHPDRASSPIPEVTGRDLMVSKAELGTQPAQGTGIVQLSFKTSGNRKIHEITRNEAVRGQQAADAAGQGSSNDPATISRFAQHFAIVLDGNLQSTPYISYKDNPDGIDPTGSGAEISNINSLGEAKELALVLASGALPFQYALVR